jgi:hypothetical protein
MEMPRNDVSTYGSGKGLRILNHLVRTQSNVASMCLCKGYLKKRYDTTYYKLVERYEDNHTSQPIVKLECKLSHVQELPNHYFGCTLSVLSQNHAMNTDNYRNDQL